MSNAAPVRAYAMRVTRTDACGVPVAEATANSRVTTAGFISVGLAADVSTSTDIVVNAASGVACVRSKGVPTLLGFNVTLQLCNVNLAIMEMLLGSAILTDYAAPVEDVGGVISSDGTFNDNTVALEWWSGNANNDACAAAGANPKRPYVHWGLPRVNRWTPSGNLDFGDAASNVTLTGYAEPSRAFAETKATDNLTVADVTAINATGGLLFWREVPGLPVTQTVGYD